MRTEFYNNYITELKTQKAKDGKLVNPWAVDKSDKFWDKCWDVIVRSGLEFDAKHITLISTGVSFDYVAYKNKMLQVYPETLIDIDLIYKGDSFAFEKENGHVTYKHIIGDPFNHTDDNILGGYCVIKNTRGEFLTLLSKSEINKARKVAKSDSIWSSWFAEMCKKTIIKKAVKFHFDDIYTAIEDEDNKNYDLDNQPDETFPEALRNAISEASSYDALAEIYKREYSGLSTAGLKADFIKYATARKQELQNENSQL